MIFLYQIVFILAFILFFPLFLLHLKKRGKGIEYLKKGLCINLCNFKLDKNKKRILFHCVSVGETLAAKPLILKIKQAFPDTQIIITTTTKTGQETAKREFKNIVSTVTYYPLDFYFSVKNFLNATNPNAVIIYETELWPMFIYMVTKRKIPLFIVNARISKKTAKIYELLNFFWKSILKDVTKICTQSKEDAERFLKIGFRKKQIAITGNMKFDQLPKKLSYEEKKILKKDLYIKESDFVIILGSTHDNEEELILKSLIPLFDKYKNIKIIIAPRHIERTGKIENLLKKLNLNYIKRTDEIKKEYQIIILNTLGELSTMYNIGDVAIIGGSFVKIGGHNILEPAQVGCIPIFGPYMFKQVPMLELAKKTKGGIQVNSEKEIKPIIEKMLKDETYFFHCKTLAKKMAEENKGATENTLEIIIENIGL